MPKLKERYQFLLSSPPPSVNVTRRADPVGKKLLSRWLNGSGWEMKIYDIRPLTSKYYGVSITFNPRKVELDLDNGIKAVIDLLHVMHMTPDDRELVALFVTFSSKIEGAVRVKYWGQEKGRADL